MPHTPTAEQEVAVSLFNTRQPLKISAFAGSGKTTTLRMLAAQRTTQGLYIAFNKAIADEASDDFPQTVDCRTTHSLAFRPVAGQFRYSQGKMTTSFYARNLADALDLGDQVFQRIKLDGLGQAYLALGAVRRFCQSDDPEFADKHVPQFGRLAAARPEELREVRAFVLDMATSVWQRMLDRSDRMPLGHDGYLKLWALQKPLIAADYILLDEAQDSNSAVLGVLREQQSQIVYVGDQHQQIYEWRGAVNAMEKIEGCAEAYLTQSFRFGSAIAKAASAVLRTLGEKRPIIGNPRVLSEIGPVSSPNAILARTNAGVMSAVIEALDAQGAPHVVGGVDALKRLLKDVVALKEARAARCPEFVGFSNWNEVLEFVRQEEGEDLRTFVQIVERFGERNLLRALNRVEQNVDAATVVISTAHKAKGKEWDSVRLTSDFISSKSGEAQTPDDAETRLFYVAMTRAKKKLDFDPVVLTTFTQRDRAADRERLKRAIAPETISSVQSWQASELPASRASAPSRREASTGTPLPQPVRDRPIAEGHRTPDATSINEAESSAARSLRDVATGLRERAPKERLRETAASSGEVQLKDAKPSMPVNAKRRGLFRRLADFVTGA